MIYRMSNPKFDNENLKNLEIVFGLLPDGNLNASFVARYVHVFVYLPQ